MWWRLQPYVVAAATLCDGRCNPTWCSRSSLPAKPKTAYYLYIATVREATAASLRAEAARGEGGEGAKSGEGAKGGEGGEAPADASASAAKAAGTVTAQDVTRRLSELRRL